MMRDKIPVAILGATGVVGQRFLSLLEGHPWFEVISVTGSDTRAGQPYGQAVHWVVPGELPRRVKEMALRPSLDPGDVALVLSALPASVALEVEPALASKGYAICSNASALRMDPDVPLLVPEINADHLRLIESQRSRRKQRGFVVTSPNCLTTGIVFPLKALQVAFGLSLVHVVTMQAISGSGYPGVASFDIQDNVIPFINGEESKIEWEPRKVLGSLRDGGVETAAFRVSAQANRVPVSDGHLAALSVKLESNGTLGEVFEALETFEPSACVRELPSAPEHAMLVQRTEDRPQPRRDRDAGNGMSVSVGRVQRCEVLDYKLVSLVHNTLRGAAGGAILNAELLAAQGYLAIQPR